MNKNYVYESESEGDENIDNESRKNEEADAIIYSLLPAASKNKYEKEYKEFEEWKRVKKFNTTDEKCILIYFSDLKKKYKSSTLWSRYSMLRSTLLTYQSIDIANYALVKAFLKRASLGHRSTKSKIFTATEIETFLNSAPDKEYLVHKVTLIIGICGGLRRAELSDLKVHDIKKEGSLLVVNIIKKKTNVPQLFTIHDEFSNYVEKYQQLRPSNPGTDRFFLKYTNGACTRQVIGINKIGEFPKIIATYLKLETPNLYTGHCFRRTAATLYADAGADVSMLKRQFKWKSDTVAMGYVDNSKKQKLQAGKMITESITLNKNSTSTSPSFKRAKMTHDNLSHHKIQPDDCINKEKIRDGTSTSGTRNKLVNDGGSPPLFSSDDEHSETTSSCENKNEDRRKKKNVTVVYKLINCSNLSFNN